MEDYFKYKGISYDIKKTLELLNKYEKILLDIQEEIKYNQKYLDYNKIEDKRYKKISDKILKLIGDKE